MFSVSFVVNEDPAGKSRPRFRRIGNFVSTYSVKKDVDLEKKIADVARKAMGDHPPLETGLQAFFSFSIPIPKSYSKKRRNACLSGLDRPSKKPDWDNLAKLAADAMNGIVYLDDSQIVEAHVRKVYSTIGCIEICIGEVE